MSVRNIFRGQNIPYAQTKSGHELSRAHQMVVRVHLQMRAFRTVLLRTYCVYTQASVIFQVLSQKHCHRV